MDAAREDLVGVQGRLGATARRPHLPLAPHVGQHEEGVPGGVAGRVQGWGRALGGDVQVVVRVQEQKRAALWSLKQNREGGRGRGRRSVVKQNREAGGGL